MKARCPSRTRSTSPRPTIGWRPWPAIAFAAGRLRRDPVGAHRSRPSARPDPRQSLHEDRRAHGRRPHRSRSSGIRARRDLGQYAIVTEALGLLSSSSRSLGVEPYARPDGQVMLGAYAFPRPFRWAILVERPERDAYLAVEKMTHSLLWWGAAGLAVAVLGAVALAFAHQPADPGDRARRGRGRQGQFRGARRARRPPQRRDRRSGPAHERDDGRAGRAVPARALRLRRHHGRDPAVRAPQRRARRHPPHADHAVLRHSRLHRFLGGERAGARGRGAQLLLPASGRLVQEHQGDIDKFVGDQILAVFVGEAASVGRSTVP